MSESTPISDLTQGDKPMVGNLVDFVEGVDKDNPLYIEVAVDEQGKVIVFHNKPFKQEVSWYEYDLDNSQLSFIMDGGVIRDSGMKLVPQIAKNMQNSHQILMVLIDDDTGEASEGDYVPLIIHKS